ncbi:MAG: type II toxin-antitoxin system HicB family antitoxin, partial [Clostridia bacterium]|nr:type II toxin-antitoxin system HicB family antitoxin [Clostridia bacterium]
MELIYPALFHQEQGSWWVEFPDLPGCFSQGETLEEALTGAEEALSLYCTVLVEDKKSLPAASNAREIAVPTDGILSLVNGKLSPRTRSVKKTLTIP